MKNAIRQKTYIDKWSNLYSKKCTFVFFFSDTKGVIGIKDVTSTAPYTTTDLGIITGPSDITYNEYDKSVTVQPVDDPSPKNTPQITAATSQQDKTDFEEEQFPKVTEYIAAVMETAVDRQNDILDGLSAIIKVCFKYMKDKDAQVKENQVTDKQISRIIDKQNSIIEVQNERLEKQQACLNTMCEVFKQVSVTHEMMADSKWPIFYVYTISDITNTHVLSHIKIMWL